jgi:glycosyltransferase involved in cell wall biosynthesis
VTVADAPAITVVLNTYNRAELLPRALTSVLGQTHSDFEVVIVDDGSTDDTADVVTSVNDERVRYVRQANAGLSVARNTGLSAARGNAVVFLDDDDWVLDTWLERLGEPFQDPGVGVACCGLTLVSPVDHQPLDTILPVDMGGAWEHVHGLFFPGSFAARRELLSDIGGYEPEMTCSHQTELSLRLVPYCLERGLQVAPVREPLLVMERRPPTDRPMNSSRRLVRGSRILVDRHRERLRRSPEMLGYYLAIAGVNAARLGDYRDARHFLWQAIRENPRLAKNYFRLLAAFVPPIGDRLWRSSAYRDVADGLSGP